MNCKKCGKNDKSRSSPKSLNGRFSEKYRHNERKLRRIFDNPIFKICLDFVFLNAIMLVYDHVKKLLRYAES